MKLLTASFCAFAIVITPLAMRAQTATWLGTSDSSFGNAANWDPNSVPNSGTANLEFGITSNTFVSFNSLTVSVNSVTFTSTATNQFYLSGNGSILTIGGGGVTTQTSSGGAFFDSGLNVALGADQTWTTASDITVQSNISGTGRLTKAGSGSLILSGNNTYTGGTTVSAGTLYLASVNSSTGTVSVGSSGTLGSAYYDLSLGNAISLDSGATLGGAAYGGDSELELTGTVTLGSTTTTLNLGSQSNVFFGGTITGSAGTALTVQSDGTGIAILGGTQSNITSMTANNAAIAFGNSAALPTTSIHAINGGYVSVADLGGTTTTPAVAAFLALITDKANFNGVLGFDTDEEANSPHVYSDAISLAGFTNGNVRIGSLTSATLTGTITPVGQSYDFGGFAAQDGLLVVKSNLVQLNALTTGVTVLSPVASGGASQNGQLVALQGNNTFTGDLTLTYSSVILDSANALPAVSSGIKMGAHSYAGYTENAFATFADFVSRVTLTGGSTTSILGIDSRDIIANYVDAAGIASPSIHTITQNIDLSGFGSISLGTLTGATINSTSITAPTDNTLRFVNSSDSAFTINTILTQSNGLVAGLAGTEGVVILNGNNTYSGGTTLLGGGLLAGHNNAFSSGTITATHTEDGNLVLGAATNGITLANNIAVTGNLSIGTGDNDDFGNFIADTTTLTLNGIISGTGTLYLTAPTTLGGTNTYTGGTFVRADTTVTNNAGLGTGNVYLGFANTNTTTSTKSVLTFSGAATAPTIGTLANADMNFYNGGTGDIQLAGTVTSLTINQASNQSFSGLITGTSGASTAALIKNGSGQLTLTGANAGQFTGGTTINAGSLAIGDNQSTTASFGGNVAIAATGNETGLFFRPSDGQIMTYNGSISGAGNVSLQGNSSATLDITGGASSFTGSTFISNNTLRISGDNLWSSASATSVNNGATLRLVGNQTIKNLSGGGTVDLFTIGKILTVNSVNGTTFGGVITGAGGLTKTGAATTFTLSGINTYTGDTTVSAGTLVLNGTVATPLVTVASGATLKGTAALNAVALDGTFAPGNSAALVTLDSLTMTSTAILQMELGGSIRGSGYDALDIANALTAAGTLSVSFINAFSPAGPATFDLFNFSSLSGTFGALNLPSLTSGLAWDTSALYTTGELSITGTAIPEPATTAAMAGLAVLALAVWRRRFTKHF